jgi:hypothetical protein
MKYHFQTQFREHLNVYLSYGLKTDLLAILYEYEEVSIRWLNAYSHQISIKSRVLNLVLQTLDLQISGFDGALARL